MIAWVSSNLQNSKNRTSEIHSFSIILDFTSENSRMQPPLIDKNEVDTTDVSLKSITW